MTRAKGTATANIAFQCDNYDICGAYFKDAGIKTEAKARIQGWGIWSGKTEGGQELSLRLCPRCCDDKRRGSRKEKLAAPEGSIPLFDLKEQQCTNGLDPK